MPTKNNIENSSNNFTALLKQYEICIDMADKISQRRGTSNKFYSALLLSFCSVIIVAFKEVCFETLDFIIVASSLGIALSFFWLQNIESYKKLNKHKYKVIFSIEKHLPIQAYQQEWESLQEESNYKSLTSIEKKIPITFICIFITLIIMSIIKSVIL